MNTDFVFETIDRFVSKFSPINTLVDLITTRLAPKAEAMADLCGCSGMFDHYEKGAFCYYTCNLDTCIKYKRFHYIKIYVNPYCECDLGCAYWEGFFPSQTCCVIGY